MGAERAPARADAARADAALPQARRRRSPRRSLGRGDDDRHPRAPRAGRRAPRCSPGRARPGVDRGSSRSRRRSPAPATRSRSPTRYDGVYACLGIHPHDADGDGRRARSTSCARSSRTERAVAVGETGLDYFRDYAPHDAQQRLFEASSRSPRELGKPVVIHTRAADDDTLARARRLRRHGHPPLLLVAGAARARARARLVRLVRRQRHLPEGARAARGGAARARRPPARRDRQPVPRAAAGPRPAQRARLRHAHARRARRGARRRRRRARGADRREREPPSSACDASSPKKALGQHFLVDENILGVIGRLAELEPADVVLEVGPGLGVLTRYLADAGRARPRGRDRPLARAEPARASRARRSTGATRSHSTSPALEPPPDKLVANLPYNIATPLVVESLDRFPTDRGLVRDGAARGRRPLLRRARHEGLRRGLGARSSSRPSAPGFHPVSREVFRPRPNVESALVAFRRTAPGLDPPVKRLVEAAFAHRRKTLANSLALAGVASRETRPPPRSGDRPRRRRRAPRQLDPAGVRRARRGARDDQRRAPAKINLALVVGPTRDRRPARGRDDPPARRSRRHDRRSSPRPSSRSRASPPTRSSARALEALAAPPESSRLARADREAHPGRRRPRRRKLGRRDRAPARERAARRAARAASELHALAARPRRRRPVLPRAGPAARHRRRLDARAARPAAGLQRSCSSCRTARRSRRRRGLRRFDGADGLRRAARASCSRSRPPAARRPGCASRRTTSRARRSRRGSRARRVPRRRQRRGPGGLRALRGARPPRSAPRPSVGALGETWLTAPAW